MVKTYFLVQTFYSPMGYLGSIMVLMPRQYFYLVSRYLKVSSYSVDMFHNFR